MPHATDKPRVGYVTIATVHSRAEARRIATHLEAAGIPCRIMDERAAALVTFRQTRVGAINIQVERAEVSRAVQLLREKTNAAGAVPSARASRLRFSIDGWKLAAIKIAAIVAFAGMLARIFFY